jgi:hypothetical protein
MATSEDVKRVLGSGRGGPEESFGSEHHNDPATIVARLKAGLSDDAKTVGSFKKGGVVPKTGLALVHKGETVVPAPTDAAQAIQQKASQSAAPAQPQQDGAPDQSDQSGAPQQGDSDQDDDSMSDDSSEDGGVNLQKAYSLLNERLIELFDGSGVRRTFTIPYIEGQATADHMQSVATALPSAGGMTNNLLLTAHHSNGKGWGSGDGHTVAHPTNKLRESVILKDNQLAIAVISAARSFLSKIAGLIGKTKTVVAAKNQLALISKYNGQGMTLMDFGSAMISLVGPPLQEVSRLHHNTKSHGPYHARLTGPNA